MRKLTVLICIFLIFSGLLLAYPEWLSLGDHGKIAELVHIWLGLIFMVVFPIYSWDHIRSHRQRLKIISRISISGGIQLMTGTGLIVTGIILLLYSADALPLPAEVHELLTYFLVGTLILHSRVTR